MNWFVYILKTVDDTLYCGISSDPIKRFEKHKTGLGAKYTKIHKPEKIVYLDKFDEKSSALKEEYRIKKTLLKSEKLELIEKNKKKTKTLLNHLN